MSKSRFNNVFIGLLALSAVSAFVVPPRWGNAVRGWGDGIFAPVSYPVRQFAMMVTRRGEGVAAPAFDTKIASADAKAEIERLRTTVASLAAQVAELRKLNFNRELAGEVGKFSLPFKVTGAGTGRDVLMVAGTSGDGLAVNMPVAFSDGIVGKVTSVGAGGAQVRLITDRGARVMGVFCRWEENRFVRLATDPPLVEGQGRGVLKVFNLHWKKVKDVVQVGDWVCLDNVQRDEDWPLMMSGYRVGQVEAVQEWARNPLFAEITVRPRINLMHLREVMVVTGKENETENVVVKAKSSGTVAGPLKAVTKGAGGGTR